MLRAGLLVSLLAAACATHAPRADPVRGVYGAQHVRLVATDDGSVLEYDCAAGEIFGPLPARGAFRSYGTHTPGTGGPERAGERPPAYPATYFGRVIGDVIELTVEADLRGGGVRLGPYRLRRGDEGKLLRCL